MSATNRGEVFLLNTNKRDAGTKALMNKFNLGEFSNKKVAVKANFNSADPFPASTHLDTLRAIVETLKEAGASDITLGERSGMGNTAQVLKKLGVEDLSKEIGFSTLILDEMSKEQWLKVNRTGTHWLHGFQIAKLFTTADKIVQTCCLKTHRFGGHFTLSLKNSVGCVAKKVPGSIYDYMWELHGSPYQRQMIAEINKWYKPDIVIMDGIKAFTDGGPDKGKEIQPNLMLASNDRVAIDAVGVAILRSFGSTNHIMNGPIFELDQIRRASELEIGVKSASEIKLTPLDEESHEPSEKIAEILLNCE